VAVGLLIALGAPGTTRASVAAPLAVDGKLVFVTFFPFHPAASLIQIAIHVSYRVLWPRCWPELDVQGRTLSTVT